MNFSPLLRPAAVVFFCLAAVSAVRAEDSTPPSVSKPNKDLTVSSNSPKSISLNATFKLKGVTGEIVQFATNAGDVNVELFSSKTPKTAAAFLKGAAATGSTSYKNSLIQRSIPGFIVQGGGYYVTGGKINYIGTRPAIPSEAGIKNTRGTLAMALSNGPNSGVGDYFFNLTDNAILDDTSDGGPFTVFGRVIGDLATVDKIAALPIRNLSSLLNGAFTDVPLLLAPEGTTPPITDFVTVKTITLIPLVPSKTGGPSILKLSVVSSNHKVVKAQISGHTLILTPVADATGKAKISVTAQNKLTGAKTTDSFNYTLK